MCGIHSVEGRTEEIRNDTVVQLNKLWPGDSDDLLLEPWRWNRHWEPRMFWVKEETRKQTGENVGSWKDEVKMPRSWGVQLDSFSLTSRSDSVLYLGFASGCPLLISYISLAPKPENLTSHTQYLAATLPKWSRSLSLFPASSWSSTKAD